MVDVAAAADGDVVGEELEGDDFQNGKKEFVGLRDVDDVFDHLPGGEVRAAEPLRPSTLR